MKYSVQKEKGIDSLLSRNNLVGRWMGFGPYYAMFPMDFALNAIQTYTKLGDNVLDPFSGRGTTLFASSVLGRVGTGVEINPLGWLYTSVKLNPANKENLLDRLHELDTITKEKYIGSHQEYSEFFNACYSPYILDFLIAARSELRWKRNKVDRTLMGFLSVHLHGKHGTSLSNQMQSVKACGLKYALKWWGEKGYVAPDLDPVELITKKIEWRYEKGRPEFSDSKIYLGDSTKHLSKQSIKKTKYNMLLTSPPYSGVTDYFYDQWLRLWLLGGTDNQQRIQDKNKNAFIDKEYYRKLIYNVFKQSKKSLADDATIYVRTDAREFTKNTTIEILRKLYPEKKMEVIHRPYTGRTQTALHGDSSKKPGETDIILTT